MTLNYDDPDVKEALMYVVAAHSGAAQGVWASGPEGKQSYHTAVAAGVEGLKNGYRGLRLRVHIIKQCRAIDPLTIWTIIKILWEVVPLLMEWWKQRRGQA